MNVDDKLTLLRSVEESGFSIKESLKRLQISSSTYYSWRAKLRKHGEEGLLDKRPIPKKQWNSLLAEEEQVILDVTNKNPEWSSREISFHITDTENFSVSESSVYRLLKDEGLIPNQVVESFPAAKEYSYKPSKVNEQWQTDATYLFVQGWGWFYLISVLDDFSRRILAWCLGKTNKGSDFADVIEMACEKSGVDPDNMPKLVSDRGPALISGDLNEYLAEKEIYHIYAAPYHPQTNGKIERWHKSMKHTVCLHVYDSPDMLKGEIGKFISAYNKKRYHESLGNVTPDDVYFGRREEIVKNRKEKQTATFMRRKEMNNLYKNTINC